MREDEWALSRPSGRTNEGWVVKLEGRVHASTTTREGIPSVKPAHNKCLLDWQRALGCTRADQLPLDIALSQVVEMTARRSGGKWRTIRHTVAGYLSPDLRKHLSMSFPKRSVDDELQRTTRENVYRTTVPCTLHFTCSLVLFPQSCCAAVYVQSD